MKKIVKLLFLIIFFQNCSFDNKTGIWRDQSLEAESVLSNSKKDIGKLNKNLNIKNLKEAFLDPYKIEKGEVIQPSIKISIDPEVENRNWTKIYFNGQNNLSNYFYTNKRKLAFKSSKLAKFPKNSFSALNDSLTPLIYEDHIISYDQRGNIYVYSIDQKKKIYEFNFYKNKYKRYKKTIYLTVQDGVIYASDNLGYMYSIDINSNKLKWAKNYGIPFRSNAQIVDNQLIISNQDNTLFSIQLNTGAKNWEYQTQMTNLKTNFINNIAVDEINKNILFVNTSGELYSVNYLTKKVNWILYLKKLSPSTETDLFSSLPIIIKENNLMLSTNKSISLFNTATGFKVWERFIVSKTKPILTQNYLFLITSDHYLMCIDLLSGETVWSQNLYKQVDKEKKLEKTMKKIGAATNIIIANSKIIVITNNGHVLLFNYFDGKIYSKDRILKSKISSIPVVSKGSIYFFDGSFRLRKYN
ncbi:MAG: PQQ-binding-like beta-propeller repeat protein [Pelagibacteraceae bacterium]